MIIVIIDICILKEAKQQQIQLNSTQPIHPILLLLHHLPADHVLNHILNYGYPASEMMNNMPIFQCINTTLTSIQKQLNTLEERHKQTDAAISELQNSLKEIKSDSSKQ